MGPHLLVHPDAGVADRQHGMLGGRRGECRLPAQVVRAKGESAAAGHRITRVDRKVEYDLLDLARVREHRPELGGKLVLQRNVLPDQGPQHGVEVLHHRVQAHEARGDHLLSAEGEELPREAGGPAGGREDFPHFGRARIFSAKPRQQEVRVPYDGGQDVVEIVRNAAGETTNGFHLLGMAKALLELRRLRHVALDRDVADDPAVLSFHRADGGLLHVGAPVLPAVDELPPPDISRRKGVPHPKIEGGIMPAAFRIRGDFPMASARE